MKKLLGILGVAFLGGAVALGGYKLLLEDNQTIVRVQEEDSVPVVRTSYTNPILNTSSMPTNFTEAAESTVHAVVHVKNTAIRTQQDPMSFFFGGRGTRQYEQVGTGSGVIISPDGYIVTNNHVIEGAKDIEITLNNRKKYKASLIGADKNRDIALLKIDAGKDLPNIPFGNSDNIKIGEWVLAVGNPYNLTSTVTAGIVSAKGRDLEGNRNIESFIQTDAAVNPGNSGGALVNTRGELIGINTAISSRTGSFIGYSFAVPSNIAKKIIDDLLEFGSVQEAILGIGVDSSDEELEGVKIGSMEEGSEALRAGLKEGDVIVKVNDVKIAKFSDLKGQLTAKRPGEYVAVTVKRDGEDLIKKVKLSKRVTFRAYRFGLELKDMTAKELKKLGIDGGAKITKSNNKVFEYYNVGAGYVITQINAVKITSASQATEILENYTGKQRMSVQLMNPSGQTEVYRF